MARPTASIQAEIDIIEARLQSADSSVASVGAGGTTLARTSVADDRKRLDELYQQLGRANGTSPMVVRGFVTGLR